MAIHFNHTILSARDSRASAKFLADVLGLPAPVHWGPFEVVTTENGANLDYMDAGEVTPQHYAFLVGEVRVRRDLRAYPGAEARLLGGPRPNEEG